MADIIIRNFQSYQLLNSVSIILASFLFYHSVGPYPFPILKWTNGTRTRHEKIRMIVHKWCNRSYVWRVEKLAEELDQCCDFIRNTWRCSDEVIISRFTIWYISHSKTTTYTTIVIVLMFSISSRCTYATPLAHNARCLAPQLMCKWRGITPPGRNRITPRP